MYAIRSYYALETPVKRPSREINIFSLSALDLFASAMGSFILIAVLLFPYYQKSAIVRDLDLVFVMDTTGIV